MNCFARKSRRDTATSRSRLFYPGLPCGAGPRPAAASQAAHASRRGFLLSGFAFFALAHSSPVSDTLDLLATDLSQGQVVAFLSHFDRGMPGYARFRDLIRALTNQTEVGSSIEITSDTGDDRRRDLELNWILEITRTSPGTRTEHRQGKVRCTFEHRGRSWIITAIDPIDFFAPPR